MWESLPVDVLQPAHFIQWAPNPPACRGAELQTAPSPPAASGPGPTSCTRCQTSEENPDFHIQPEKSQDFHSWKRVEKKSTNPAVLHISTGNIAVPRLVPKKSWPAFPSQLCLCKMSKLAEVQEARARASSLRPGFLPFQPRGKAMGYDTIGHSFSLQHVLNPGPCV